MKDPIIFGHGSVPLFSFGNSHVEVMKSEETAKPESSGLYVSISMQPN